MTKDKCPHLDGITYLELTQEDGRPFYNVECRTCNKKGIIYLEEGDEEWFD